MKKPIKSTLFSLFFSIGAVLYGAVPNMVFAFGSNCVASTGGGVWNASSTWTGCPSPGGFPDFTDSATLPAGMSAPVTVSGQFPVGYLNFLNGGILQGTSAGAKITSGSTLYSFNANWISPTSVITLNNIEVEMAPGSNLNIQTSALGVSLINGAKLTVQGTVSQNAGIVIAAGAEIFVGSGGTLNINNSISGNIGGGSLITVAGVAGAIPAGTVTSAVAPISNVSIINNGVINCATSDCGISIGAANTFTMNAGAKLKGGGSLNHTSGTLTLAGGEVSITSINAPTVNNIAATLKPSADSFVTPRTMLLSGDYTGAAGSTIWVHIYPGGTDLINIAGNATLNGDMQRYFAGAQPGNTTTRDIIEAQSITRVSGFPINEGTAVESFQLQRKTTGEVVPVSTRQAYRLTYLGSRWVVTDSLLTGPGSLYTAINAINADGLCDGTPYDINFYFTTPSTISPVTGQLVPTLGTCATLIDGVTSNALPASADSNGPKAASTAMFTVTISPEFPTSCAACDGLRATGPNPVEIRGLHIKGFTGGAGINVSGTGITKVFGNKLLGNNFGVFHNASSRLEIGSNTTGDKNIISSNLNSGIHSINQILGSTQSKIINNLIGVAPDGVSSAGNVANGILVNNSNEIFISNNIIANSAKGITIAGTPQRVRVESDSAVGANRIYNNSAMGIDLEDDGPSDNDLASNLDMDSGANGLTNHPTINNVTHGLPSDGQITIDFTLNALPNTMYTVGVCFNLAGESQCRGEDLIDSSDVITNAVGNSNPTFAFPIPGGYTRPYAVTMFATVKAGPEAGNTSEFSPPFTVTAPPVFGINPLVFGSQNVMVPSGVLSTTLMNPTIGGGNRTITSIVSSNPLAFYDTNTLPANLYCGLGPTGTGSVTLTPGQSCALNLVFNPQSATDYAEVIIVTYSDSTVLLLDVYGAGTLIPQTIIGFTPTSPVVAGGSAALSATGGTSGNPVTFSALSSPTICTVAGNLVSFLSAGTCALTANQAGNVAYAAAPKANANIVINAAPLLPQTITGFAPASPVLVGAPSVALSAAGGGSGLPVTFATSSPASVCVVNEGVVIFVGPGTCMLRANQAGNAIYTPASQVTANVVITVSLSPQTITGFAPPSSVTLGTAPLALSASGGGSNNLVVFASTSAATICTVSGGVVTFVGLGPCNLTADQAAGPGYSAAPQVSASIIISTPPLSVEVTFAPASVAVGVESQLRVTISNSNAVTASALALNITLPAVPLGLTFTATGGGGTCGGIAVKTATTVTLTTASVAGLSSCVFTLGVSSSAANAYVLNLPIGAITSIIGGQIAAVSASLAVALTPQVIVGFSPPATVVVGAPAITLAATGGRSNNAVVYATSSPATVCTVTANVVAFVSAGSCVITANQAGNQAFAAAPQLSATIVIGLQAQVITGFTPPASVTVGAPAITLAATGGGSNNAVVYATSSATTVCTVTANVVAFAGAGTCVLTANQAGNARFSAAQEVTARIVINPASQLITGFSTVFPVNLGAAPASLTATGGASGNAVVFATSSAATICKVATNFVTFTGAGICNITANQAGNTNYLAAPQITQSVVISPGLLAIVEVLPANLALLFSGQIIDTTSASQQVRISNTGNASLAFRAITLNGANFILLAPAAVAACSATTVLAPTQNCTVAIAFKPIAVGASTGTLSFTTEIAATPVAVTLSGIGLPVPKAGLQLSSRALNFSAQTLGLPTDAQQVRVTNGGDANLVISKIEGNGDFGFRTNCPIAPDFLRSLNSCVIDIIFRPVALDVRRGQITIISNAQFSAAELVANATPNVIALTGTGAAVPVPAVALSPPSVRFASQTVGTFSEPQTVILTNTGFANLLISNTRFAGDAAFDLSTNAVTQGVPACGSAVAPGGRCSYSFVFVPNREGALDTIFMITSNLSNSPTQIALSGAGTPRPRPSIALSNTVGRFADQIIATQSATQTITVGNVGDAVLSLGSIVISGANAADFSFMNGATAPCSRNGQLLNPGATCQVLLGFNPSTFGTKAARLHLPSDALNAVTVNAVELSGIGIAAPVPQVSLLTTAIGFGNAVLAGGAAPQSIVLTNTGTAPLLITSIIALGDFTQTNNCGASLAPNATCTVSIGFNPAAIGNRTGELIINSNATPVAVSLSGTSCRVFSLATLRQFLTLCN